MNKRQRDNLGLTQIYDLILAPSSFLAGIKRHRIAHALSCGEEVSCAYSRRAALMEQLRQDSHHKYSEILTHLAPFFLPPEGSPLSLPDLYEIKSFIYHYQKLMTYAHAQKLEVYDWVDLSAVFELLDPESSGLPGFRLSPLYSSRLSDLDKERQQQTLSLKHERHALLKEAKSKLGIPKLKESFCLSRSEGELISKLEHSQYFVLTAQSVANLSFGLADSPSTNSIKAEIDRLNTAIEAEEERVLARLSTEVFSFKAVITRAIETCADFGWDYMLAEFGLCYSCVIPGMEADRSPQICLKGLRNLALELSLLQGGRHYQSLDIRFDDKANLITGPNMGGKTSLLRALAQCAELFRRGIPLPADEAEMPYYDYVFYNNEQESENLSSFGAEVVALNKALAHPGRGLYLLDEFARGTNPTEGEALATAVIRHLAMSTHTTIAATHYTMPTRVKGISHFQIKGINSIIIHNLKAESSLDHRLRALAKAMDYACVPVDENSNPPMNAIHIAELLGLPAAILNLLQEQKDAED